MSYYINAYRKGNHISIPVEEKHLYKQGFTATNIKTYTTTPPQQNYLDTEDVVKIANLNDIQFDQGVEVSQLVGNKIFLKDVAITLNVRASAAFMSVIHSGSPAIDYFSNCRIMAVQFDNDLSDDDLDFCDWFRTTYIYYGTETINQKIVPIQSVHQNRMRESTPWTGRFNILKDIPFKITKQKSCFPMSFTLDFKKDLTLMPVEITSGTTTTTVYKPVNDDFKHVYIYFLGPGNYSLDNDAMTSKNLAQYSGGVTSSMFEIAYNIKYTFYDLN